MGPTRRRSALAQDRSRRTRQLLIRSALQLWSERGFEDGIERTGVDEIVKAAGVTKGTFYFHFARKEEILLEMGFGTAEVVTEEAKRCVARQRPLDDSMRRVIAVMSRHVRAAPPTAVGRSVAEFRRRPRNELLSGRPHIADGLELVFQAAMDRGELGDHVDAHELAAMTAAVMMETFVDWVSGAVPLTKTLNRRAMLLLDGVRGGG